MHVKFFLRKNVMWVCGCVSWGSPVPQTTLTSLFGRMPPPPPATRPIVRQFEHLVGRLNLAMMTDSEVDLTSEESSVIQVMYCVAQALCLCGGGGGHSVQTIGGHCTRPTRGWTHTSPSSEAWTARSQVLKQGAPQQPRMHKSNNA